MVHPRICSSPLLLVIGLRVSRLTEATRARHRERVPGTRKRQPIGYRPADTPPVGSGHHHSRDGSAADRRRAIRGRRFDPAGNAEAHALRFGAGQVRAQSHPAPGWRQVLYEAQLGPLAPGPYDVWVGRWDPNTGTVVVTTQPLHVEVP